ncbi:MAG: hypothetical protein KQH63_19030 [Desulfobulbaceae bacterium]|nr:hypothetical protein [Desulfobulbaceae bacterium]
MRKTIIRNCSRCNQQLRIPSDIGGMLMQCPDCGHEFHTDFKLGTDLTANNGTEKDTDSQPSRPARKSTFQIIV